MESVCIECEQCGSQLRVHKEHAGTRCQCSQCGHLVFAPSSLFPIAASGPAADGYTLSPEAPVSDTVEHARSRIEDPSRALMKKLVAPGAVSRMPSTPAGRAAAAKAFAASTRSTAPRKVDLQARQQQVLASISGKFEPIDTTFAYRAWSCVAALAMIALPVAYVGLIVLLAAGVGYHVMFHGEMLQEAGGSGTLAVFAAYLAPVFAGAVAILFLVKPLLAQPANYVRSRSLSRKSDPVLFAFVEKLCATIHAPIPSRIEVDHEVNASASFEAGWRGIFDGRLTLTLGMPLAAGLSLEQFGGVISHELGHFTQRGGMRLSYVVRFISAWFNRVVFERDEWDLWLERAHRGRDWRLAAVILASQACVWLTRRVLWILMQCGNLVSGLLQRQMEFNADLHEIRFAGSQAFEGTQLRLRLLNQAAEQARRDLADYFENGELPDNLSQLIQSRVDRLPREAVDAAQEAIREDTASWWSTHPSDQARVEAAQREDAPGLFHCAGPASILFTDFDGLCRNVTWDLYRGLFGVHFDPKSMDATEMLLAREAAVAK